MIEGRVESDFFHRFRIALAKLDTMDEASSDAKFHRVIIEGIRPECFGNLAAFQEQPIY